MNRLQLEAEYRKYFSEVRKFEPFPMTVSYENVLDFLEWHEWQKRCPDCVSVWPPERMYVHNDPAETSYEYTTENSHLCTNAWHDSMTAPCGRLKCQ